MKNVLRVIKICLPKVSRRGQVALFLYSFSLIMTSLIDGISLLLISNLINQVDLLETTFSTNFSVRTLIVCMALFFLRSVLASLVTWFGIMTFAKEEVSIGQKNFTEYSQIPWANRSREKLSDLYSFIDRGPNAIVQQLLLSFFTLVAEIGSAVLVFAFIVSLDWVVALSVGLFFSLIGLFQYKITKRIASRTGTEIAEYHNQSYDVMSDVFFLGKTLQVMKSASLEDHLARVRLKLARSRAQAVFLDSFARFLLEVQLAVGIIVVGAIIWVIRGPDKILAFLVIFAIAGFRILPSLNRIQGLLTSLVGREPIAQLGIRELHTKAPGEKLSFGLAENDDHILRVVNISFSYPNAKRECLNGVSLDFKRGYHYAIVGPSGSGKTTLVDICMGLIDPSEGSVQWANSVADSIAYVPQETYLTTSSLANNVAIEWDSTLVDEKRLHDAMEDLSLKSILNSDKSDIHSGRLSLSGGQKQKVGISRALYRKAQVIFLDEPTSSLDSESELEVMKAINNVRAKKTLIIIAHRLSTIRKCDFIVYLEEGKVLAVGTFDQLHATLPQFKRFIELEQAFPI